MKFKIANNEQVRTVIANKAEATEIDAGDLVAITDGLIVKAAHTSDAVALAPYGAGDDTTEIEVTIGNDFILSGTAEANFAVDQKGTAAGIIETTQTIDEADTESKGVLTIDVSKDAGTVDSKDDVRVKIEKPIF